MSKVQLTLLWEGDHPSPQPGRVLEPPPWGGQGMAPFGVRASPGDTYVCSQAANGLCVRGRFSERNLETVDSAIRSEESQSSLTSRSLTEAPTVLLLLCFWGLVFPALFAAPIMPWLCPPVRPCPLAVLSQGPLLQPQSSCVPQPCPLLPEHP